MSVFSAFPNGETPIQTLDLHWNAIFIEKEKMHTLYRLISIDFPFSIWYILRYNKKAVNINNAAININFFIVSMNIYIDCIVMLLQTNCKGWKLEISKILNFLKFKF